MKKLTTVLLGASLLISGIASASVTTFEKANNDLSTELCMAIAKGKTKDLRSIMHDRRLNKSRVTKKLYCNELPAVEFSETFGKNKTKMKRFLENS